MTTGLSAQQLLDDFNYPPGTTVIPGWVEGGTANTASIQNSWNGVDVTCRITGSTTAAADWISRDVSGYYDTQLNNNSCVLEWAVNLRRVTGSGTVGFDQGGTQNGMAYMLAGSNLDPETGQGYAVVVGQPGNNYIVRLVRFTGGLDANANLSTLISGGTVNTHYASIRVSLDPTTDTWELFYDQNNTTGPYLDPTLAATSLGTMVDGTYTGANLDYTACLWNHRNNAAFACEFEDVHVPNSCVVGTPTVEFTSVSTTGFEDLLGSVVVGLSVLPSSPTAQTVTVSVTNGPGVVYGAGNDYTCSPAVGGGLINVNVPAGQTSANITLNILNDAGIESTEDIQFQIISASGGLLLGTDLIHDVRIYDDDTPPATLVRGDLLIVGINANNLACSGNSAEDEISFFCFKEITRGTLIDMTDCAFEHFVAGRWGENNEGKVRLERTGAPIPAGTVITLRALGTGIVSVVAPDADWAVTIHSGFFNLNSTSGDQIFFLQGGNWNNPGGLHNTDYIGGAPLYGFSSDPSNWVPFTQQSFNSGLPLTMDCFSMAPTASTNFTKYTGPTAATDQRSWIIRVGEPSNWTAFANCSAYNSGAPDYVSGVTFSFTTVGFTTGLWRGRPGNRDWFDCSNWDDAQVPDASTNVIIDDRAINHCDVDGGGTAACLNLDHNITGTNWILTVNNGSQLDVSGDLTMNKSNTSTSGKSLIQIWNGAGMLVSGDVELNGYTTGLAQAATLVHNDPSGSLEVLGDMRINVGGFLDMYTSGGVGGVLTLEGDFVNNHQEQAFDQQSSVVEFTGSLPQKISGTGTFIERFGTIRLSKVSDDLTIDHTIRLTDLMQFTSGRAINSSKIVFDNNSLSSGMSNASFATGPVEKIGNQDFVFPVGKATYYRPVTITSQSSANVNTAFVAEYYLSNPQIPYGNTLVPSLDHISACEYWILERSSGSPNAYVTLGWEAATSCSVTLLADLRIARHDGSTWQDHGASNLTGGIGSGTLRTSTFVSNFSPFTLASVSNQNPLPVELIAFSATALDASVQLDWTTASELNNDHFIVERSSDGLVFETVDIVPGQGTTTLTTDYKTFDLDPYSGLSYYRLKQVDFNGEFEYSQLVAVEFGQYINTIAWVNAGILHLSHQHFGQDYSISDAAGRIVLSGALSSNSFEQLAINHLASGIYTIHVGEGQNSFFQRFLR